MLKKIPSILSPSLVKTLMEMGHGDKIVIADGNFPATNYGQRVIRADGLGVVELLDAILELFPLDIKYSQNPVEIMELVNEQEETPQIWQEFRQTLTKHYDKMPNIEKIERYSFYEESKKSFAIIATTETAIYANIILTKGLV